MNGDVGSTGLGSGARVAEREHGRFEYFIAAKAEAASLFDTRDKHIFKSSQY